MLTDIKVTETKTTEGLFAKAKPTQINHTSNSDVGTG